MYTEIVIYWIMLLVQCWVHAIFWHELAHILYYKRVTGCWPKVYYHKGINVGTDNQLRKLKTKQKRIFYLVGPLAGVVPFIICPVPWVAMVGFGVYMYGCVWDFKRFIQ